MKKLILTCLSMASFASLFSDETIITDNSTGVNFPIEISFQENGTNYTLEATGLATRKKFIAKVYSIVHYMQDPVNGTPDVIIAEVLDNDSKAKQLSMQWVRNVSSQKIQNAYESALNRTLSGEMGTEIDQFVELFGNGAKKGDTYTFRWLPDGVLTIDINGSRVGSFDNGAFAKGVWGIWLGEGSPVSRDKLVSRYSQ